MSHERVGELQLLGAITKEKLRKYKPASIASLGVCGGDDLEHIDTRVTIQVYKIDINSLAGCKIRYGHRTDITLIQD